VDGLAVDLADAGILNQGLVRDWPVAWSSQSTISTRTPVRVREAFSRDSLA
jgi:hypothetical protein